MNANKDKTTEYIQREGGRMLCTACGAIVAPERAMDKYCTRCGRLIVARRWATQEEERNG